MNRYYSCIQYEGLKKKVTNVTSTAVIDLYSIHCLFMLVIHNAKRKEVLYLPFLRMFVTAIRRVVCLPCIFIPVSKQEMEVFD